jgi:glycosyltransferase involved in cell wall biosynthesis
VGGTPELLGENERGLLFERGNAGALAEALGRLIDDASLRRELGERAARHAREKLSIEIAVERMSAIYEKLLTRRGIRVPAATGA